MDPPGGSGCGLRARQQREIIAELTSHLRLNVELSGGIRDDESLERALATGCARVNIGTAALERPEWCEEIIDRYGTGLPLAWMSEEQARRPRLDPGGRRPLETLHRLDRAGCARFVITTYPPTACFAAPTSTVAPGVRGDRQAGDRQRRHLHH